jgi:hypothetical protein
LRRVFFAFFILVICAIIGRIISTGKRIPGFSRTRLAGVAKRVRPAGQVPQPIWQALRIASISLIDSVTSATRGSPRYWPSPSSLFRNPLSSPRTPRWLIRPPAIRDRFQLGDQILAGFGIEVGVAPWVRERRRLLLIELAASAADRAARRREQRANTMKMMSSTSITSTTA